MQGIDLLLLVRWNGKILQLKVFKRLGYSSVVELKIKDIRDLIFNVIKWIYHFLEIGQYKDIS